VTTISSRIQILYTVFHSYFFHVFTFHLRFPDMTTEYLALWVHFLWSGLFTIAFSAVAWWQFGLATGRLSVDQAATEGAREAIKQRRRLFHIAVMVTACLLVMMGALLSTSLALGEWSRTADISLACAIKETPFARNWEAYGFDEGGIVEVCSVEDAIQVAYPCQGGCFWYPDITSNSLTCQNVGHWFESLKDFAESGRDDILFNSCDCPCSNFIQLERPRFGTFMSFHRQLFFISAPPSSLHPPSSKNNASRLQSVATLTLAHVAQSLVVTVVGLNLGFRFEMHPFHQSHGNAESLVTFFGIFPQPDRKENLGIWKKFFRKHVLSHIGSTSVAVAGSEYKAPVFDSKAYD
jgi:hypothetical protein